MAQWRRLALATGGLAVTAVLWFALIGHPGIWTDEDFSLRFAESYATVDDDLHPPTYYALLRTWFLLTPDTLVSARVLSAAAFVGAVAVWGLLGRRWCREGRVPGTAVVAMVVLALVSPHAILFGRMARYFGLVGLTTAVALWCWWALLERPRRSVLVAAIAAHVGVGLLSYPAFVVLAGAEGLTVLLRRRPVLGRHLVMSAVASAVWLVAVVALPTDDRQFGGSEDVNRPAMAAVAVSLPLWSATVGETVSPLDPLATGPVLAAWGVLALAMLAALRTQSVRARDPDGALRIRWLPEDPAVLVCLLLVVGTLASLIVVTLTVDLAHTGLQSPKYFAPIVPALYLLAGLGIARMRSWSLPAAVWLVVAGIGIGWAFGLVHLYRGEDYLYPSYALPWEDVADATAVVASTQVDAGHDVLVVSSDRAVLRLLADREVPADLFDTNALPEDAVVRRGAPTTTYDVFVLIERQRLNAPAEASLTDLRELIEGYGFREVSSQTFGSVDAGLRSLQERFSGRDLDEHLVEVDVLVDD